MECYYISFSLVLKTPICIIAPIVASVKFPCVTTRRQVSDGNLVRNRAGKLNSANGTGVVEVPKGVDRLVFVKETSKTVVLADPQIGFRKNHNTNELVPFHDRGVLDVALQITWQINPDTVVINGDWLDMSEWSDKFTREPGVLFSNIVTS